MVVTSRVVVATCSADFDDPTVGAVTSWAVETVALLVVETVFPEAIFMPIEDVLLLSDKRDCDCLAVVLPAVDETDLGEPTVVVFMAWVVAVVGAADTGDSTDVVFIARVVAAVLVTLWIVELLVAETVLPGVVIKMAEVVSLLSIERDDDCLAVVFRVPAVSSALPVVLTAGAVCSADLEDPTPAGISVWVVGTAAVRLVVEPAALSGVSETVLVSGKVASLLSVKRDGGDCLVVSLLSAVRTVCATPAVEASGIGVDTSYLVTVPVD